MSRRRRKAAAEELFDVLIDLTDIFWEVGAAVTAVLTFATFWTLDWAVEEFIRASASPLLEPLVQRFGWVLFLLPLVIATLTIIFGVKSFKAFCREHRY